MEVDDFILESILDQCDLPSIINLACVSKTMYASIQRVSFESCSLRKSFTCATVDDMVRSFTKYQLFDIKRNSASDLYIGLSLLQKRHTTLRSLLTREQEIVSQIAFKRRTWYVVQAYAGTGKTTTLYHICNNNRDKRILYLAFNKSLEQQAREGRLGQLAHVDCFTFHSYTKQELEKKKISFDIINDYSLLRLKKIFPRLSLDYLRTVYYEFKRFCYSSASEPKGYVKRLWDKMVRNIIPFTHDAYLKYFDILQLKMKYDIILLDEAQDSSECMLSILKRQRAARVLIGDSYQQIYKFRGSVDPFEMIQSQLQPNEYETYWLSHTFRYGIDLAHITNLFLQDYMDLKANITTYSPENTFVYTFTGDPVFRKERFDWESASQKMLICCTNKTLYDNVFKYVLQHKYVHIIGNEKDYREEIRIVYDFMNIEMQQYELIQTELLQPFRSLEDVADYFYSLDETTWIHRLVLYDEYGAELITYFQLCKTYVDSEESPEYILSTIHKCKGLEFDHVKLAEDFPVMVMNEILFKRKTQVWKERYNTIYVALTRAKKTLTLNTTLSQWIQYHLQKRKSYCRGHKNTCRTCGILTDYYENSICTCESCSVHGDVFV